MGTIKFRGDEVHTHKYTLHGLDKIIISDWRSLQVSGKEKRLKVVTNYCDEVIINNITQDEFHEINYCNKTVYKSYSITRCLLACKFCGGTGKTDWIKKVMEEPTSSYIHLFPHFDRDAKREILIVELLRPKNLTYISSPKLTSVQEICSHCYGSGLNHIQNCKILDRLFIEFC